MIAHPPVPREYNLDKFGGENIRGAHEVASFLGAVEAALATHAGAVAENRDGGRL